MNHRRSTTLITAGALAALIAAATQQQAQAQTARERFLTRIGYGTASAGFTAANQVDLSRFSTASRNELPRGADCVGFSHIGAIEARFNHKYCAPGTANAFRQAAYCQRYDAVTTTPFYMTTNYANWYSDTYLNWLKEVNLSEHYYLHRTFTQATAATGSNHETLTMVNFGDQMIAGRATDRATFWLPEEADAPFINDANFWQATGSLSLVAYLGGPNFPQSRVDEIEFKEHAFPTFIPGSPINRPSISLAARKNARFGVTDIFHGKMSTFGTTANKLQFLERAIYAGFEVALHGAQPGHSMLLVGYDRTARVFHFKDHVNNWTRVGYDTAVNAGTYTIVQDVTYDAEPSREEMWLGEWELDLDGRVGTLIIRRTRQPSNSYYMTSPTDNIFDQTLVEMPRDKWARVGSYSSGGPSYVVYGRLGTDGDDGTLELSIDQSQPEGGPSTLAQHAAGFTVQGQVLPMRLMSSGPGTAAYATGVTVWGNRNYGVLMRRPGHTELGSVPHVAGSGFTRTRWTERSFTLRFEDGSMSALYVYLQPSGAATAWRYDYATARWFYMDGWIYQDNAIVFYTSDTSVPRAQSLHLLYHTWELGVLSGADNFGRPMFGVGN